MKKTPTLKDLDNIRAIVDHYLYIATMDNKSEHGDPPIITPYLRPDYYESIPKEAWRQKALELTWHVPEIAQQHYTLSMLLMSIARKRGTEFIEETWRVKDSAFKRFIEACPAAWTLPSGPDVTGEGTHGTATSSSHPEDSKGSSKIETGQEEVVHPSNEPGGDPPDDRPTSDREAPSTSQQSETPSGSNAQTQWGGRPQRQSE